MNEPQSLAARQYRKALEIWASECEEKMRRRFPRIDFRSTHWPVKTLHGAAQRDWYFTEAFAAFASKDSSFQDVVRCLVAEMVLAGKPAGLDLPILAFRMLATSSIGSIFEIELSVLRNIESNSVRQARSAPASAQRINSLLRKLEELALHLASKGVTPHIGFRIAHSSKRELSTLAAQHRAKVSSARGATLDVKINAFNDALNALHANDPRLAPEDRVAIAAVALLMCAPSRINELLCMSVDDYVTIDDYADRPSEAEIDDLHAAHQSLLITMKGSKGAQWGAKPALNFMIDVFNYAIDVIKQHGARSRELVRWYASNPNKLFLPAELEHLRGRVLTARDLASIVYQRQDLEAWMPGFAAKMAKRLKIPKVRGRNTATARSDGTPVTRTMVFTYAWSDIERALLLEVHSVLLQCRRLTAANYYVGDLEKMLFLLDDVRLPFLPGSAKYASINLRLKQRAQNRDRQQMPTLFQKLGIMMPVAGLHQIAELTTHDPRRWLTTQALRHGEKLSDVLISKWANRSSLAQLQHYDLRPSEEIAATTRIPEPNELKDISAGLAKASVLEAEFGLQVEIVAINDAEISLTSMDSVAAATDDRPIARSSNQIIILYPSQYGVCLHQHHETPCQRYDSCLPCDENIVVKGHLPTNERIRQVAPQLLSSVIRQLDRLVFAHNRDIADYPKVLGDHMSLLVERGLSSADLANHLIDEFHQIKDLIKDKLLRKRLEEAFVARGTVERLDNPQIPGGALIKYHNPACHASPSVERALESHGGRSSIKRKEEELAARHPMLAGGPTDPRVPRELNQGGLDRTGT